MPDSTPSGAQPTPSRPPESPWSWRLMTVKGIPIRLHATFLLLLIWLAFNALQSRAAAPEIGILYVLGIFACVVLHELGHSFAALRFGIRVREIVLYPIGGIASIERLPKPHQELVIALAGPAVNLIIFLLLAIGIAFTDGLISVFDVAEPGRYWQKLLVANAFMAFFNLLPAFPMDGGRVLRALLGMAMPELKATEIAGRVGQFMAFMFGLIGVLLGGWSLLFIALFVYIGATQEMAVYHSRAMLEGVRVDDALITEFQSLPSNASLRDAAQMLLSTEQRDFPILFDDQPIGLLTRNALIRSLANKGPDEYVSGAMERDFVTAKPTDPMENLLVRMQSAQCETALVLDNGRLLGLVTVENVRELLTVRAMAHARNASAT